MRSLLPALAAGAILLALPAAAGDLAQRLDAAIDKAVAERRIVGTVVLVARDGALVYRRAAGLSDREAGVPMREDTIFRLASVSKPLVSAAVMTLVEEGRLRLDEPVTGFLPDFRPQLADGRAPAITIGHLLSHAAGLSYGFFEPEDSRYKMLAVSDGLDIVPGLTLDANLRRLSRTTLAFPPGSNWRYSLSIDVLGAVIEKVTGQTLAQAVAERVTAPLGLKDTGFAVTDPARLGAAYADGRPAPSRMTDNELVPFAGNAVRFAPGRALDPTAYPSGGAGMVGTAGDVLRFLEAIRTGGGPILKPETVEMMMADQVGAQAQTQGPGWGFGFGWAVLDDPAPTKTPQAAGTIQWGGAYGHSWFVDPASRLTVVALTNTAFEGMSGAYTIEIRDAVYGPR
ncbi:MAG: serine hydrolase domain-containing protein [Ferrovibrionaceae bacterium]